MRDDYRLSLTTHSNLRTDVLIDLSGGKKHLDDLRNDLNVSSPTASHTLRELEDDKLVYQDAERNYVLTNIGRIIAHELIDLRTTTETLHTFESFWLEHDMSGIPDHLLERIGCLRGATLIEEGPGEVFKTFKTLIRLLEGAAMIRLITTFITEIDWSPGANLFIVGPDIQNVVTSDALGMMLKTERREYIAEALHKGLTMYVTEKNPKLALAVTDRHMILGLFNVGGPFDTSRMLVCDRAEGIEWGLALFNYYREISSKVVL